jgi:4-hydroxybenzoate polyprenyltransferase
MRPKQWTKNVFVWAALVFDRKLLQRGPFFVDTLVTFILFCMISSAVYIINDLADIEQDRWRTRQTHASSGIGALNRA